MRGHRTGTRLVLFLGLSAVALAGCHKSSHAPTQPDCADACTAGATRCGSSTTVEACAVLPTGCLGWTLATTCFTGSGCSVGPGGAACGTPNLQPTASFTANPNPIPAPPFDVTFDASASSDPDGTIVSYAWSFGDGGTSSGVTASHRYTSVGAFTATLTVTDDRGGTSTSSVSIGAGVPPTDPLYGAQWHLENTGQVGRDGVPALAGIDVNVEPAWNVCGAGATCRGEGALVAVVDTGVQIAHPDLQANVLAGASFNFRNGGTDPTPAPGDPPEFGHGTAVAGIVAARDLNGVGGRGVAPRASLAGYNFIALQTDASLVESMTRNAAAVSVNTNSWGPGSDGNVNPAPTTWRQAIEEGLSIGRGSQGIVYLFAAGNGAPNDDSNYDGFANYHGVMAIGAVNALGVKSSYSSQGANLWVAAPGGEFCSTLAITTTDLTGAAGINPGLMLPDLSDLDYTRCMNGTSSATPNVAGVAALVVQANPSLSWRDVRLVLASTARKVDAGDADWTTNAAGVPVSHKYGFGLVNADAAVTAAKTWTSVPALKTCTTALRTPNLLIPDAPARGTPGPAVQDSMTVSGCASGTLPTSIEFVEVEFSAADHPYLADLDVRLSHGTTVSRLARTHACINPDTGVVVACTSSYAGWVFGTTHHLAEAPTTGTWTLTVQDGAPVDTGHFQSWRLIFYGH